MAHHPKNPHGAPQKKPTFQQKGDVKPAEQHIDSESMDFSADFLDSLKASEIQEVLDASAEEAAKSYAAGGEGNYEECVLVVNTALTLTGKALGGKLGAGMAAASHEAAEKVCKRYFSQDKKKS